MVRDGEARNDAARHHGHRGERRLVLPKPKLEVETIEGDRIEVEAVIARRIRGDVVVIGDDCRVDRIEYRTSCERRGSAIVEEAVQI